MAVWLIKPITMNRRSTICCDGQKIRKRSTILS